MIKIIQFKQILGIKDFELCYGINSIIEKKMITLDNKVDMKRMIDDVTRFYMYLSLKVFHLTITLNKIRMNWGRGGG